MRYRYRLQRKESWIIPNVLGNRSMPVYSWRWKDICASNDYNSLADIMKEIVAKGCGNLYRIEDTEGAFKVLPKPQTKGDEPAKTEVLKLFDPPESYEDYLLTHHESEVTK